MRKSTCACCGNQIETAKFEFAEDPYTHYCIGCADKISRRMIEKGVKYAEAADEETRRHTSRQQKQAERKKYDVKSTGDPGTTEENGSDPAEAGQP